MADISDDLFADIVSGKDESDKAPNVATPITDDLFDDIVPPKSAVTAGGAFARSAATGVLPSAAFAATAGAVFPWASGLAAETGPFAPVIGGVASLIAGGGAAALTALTQRKVARVVAPEAMKEFEALQAQDIAEHPAATFTGELASGIPAFRIAPGTVYRGIRALPEIVRGTAGTAEKIAAVQAGGRLGAGAIIGAATPIILEQRAPTMRDVAAGMAFVGLYGEPRWKPGLVKLPKSLAAATEAAPVIPFGRTAEHIAAVPTGMRIAPAATAPETRGGLAATEEMIAQLPQGSPEVLAINELTRSVEPEMQRLVEQEGAAIRRTGEALPQPVKVGTIPTGALPAAETLARRLSGMRIAPEQAALEAKGGLPTAEPTLDLLPAAKVEELALNELLRQGVERGEALSKVEALGDTIRRRANWPRAEAEKFVQQVGEGEISTIHPNKPITANQLRIIHQSLTRAIADNRLSGIENWADGVIKETGKQLRVGLDPEQLAAYAVKGAALLARGVRDAASWAREMARLHGDAILPYLKPIYDQSQKFQKAKAVAEPFPSSVIERHGDYFENMPSEHLPVEIERPDGRVVPAIMNGYYVPIPGLSDTHMPSVGTRSTRGWSHTALVPSEGRLLTRVPSAEEWSSESVKRYLETKPKEATAPAEAGKEPNALTEPSPTKIYADVPAQPAEGAQEVPAEEGGLRIPPSQETPLGGTVGLGTGHVVSEAIKSFRNIAADIRVLVKRAPIKRDISALADAAFNEAGYVGRQAGKSVTVAVQSNVVADRAATVFRQAKGDVTTLLRQAREMADIAKTSTDLDQAQAAREAQAAIQYALDNPAEARVGGNAGGARLTEAIGFENAHGQNVPFRDAYVPGRHEDVWNDHVIFGEQRGTGGSFKKGKVFDSYVEAIKAGFIPKTLQLSKLVESRVAAGRRMVNHRLWAEGFKDVIDPVSGEPVARDIPHVAVPRPDGTVDYQERVPRGYEKFEISTGVNIAVRKGFSRIFDALTARSRIAASPGFQAIAKGEALLKSGLLFFDTFHISRVLQAELALGKWGYKKGLSLLEYRDADLAAAAEQGLIPQEAADWVRGSVKLRNTDGTITEMPRRQLAELLIKRGLNVGRVHDAMYTDIVRAIPGIGKINEWVFEKLTRGVMLETAMNEVERLSGSKPINDIVRDVSRDTNIFFGNLGRQGLLKDATFRDIARIIFLAPQWVESLAQKEARFAKRTLFGAGRFAVGKPLGQFSTISRGMATGLVGYFVATQLVNLRTRGHFTWQNPEEDHKMDAWIPGGEHGFFISPLSVFAEITHDLIRYGEKKPTVAEAVMQIAYNKLSPIGRAIAIIATGEDIFGRKLNTSWDRIKTASFQLAPVPIGIGPIVQRVAHEVAPGLVQSTYPGAEQRQAMSSVGLRAEPASGPVSRMQRKADSFQRAQGRLTPKITLGPPDDPIYVNLLTAIRTGREKDAMRILSALRQTHPESRIMQSLRASALRPFTGSRPLEQRFYSSLSEADQKLYIEAQREKWADLQKYQQFVASHR